MANLIDVKVPDIGEFSDVPIIEVLVKPGDPIKAEQSLITLESDKASMEVPSPVDGVVKEIKVKVGDKVSEGTLILTAEAEAAPAGVAPKEKVTGGGTATGEGAPVADYGAASGVYEVVEVRVPDIGDFKDVPIIEIAVKGGDKVKPEDPLITLESDKASMEVPSPTRRHREGPEGQHRGQGQCRKPDPDIGDRSRRRSSGRALGSTRVGDRAGRAGPAGGQTFGRRRRRMRHAGSRRRTGRLFGGVPLRRPWHDDGAGGALSDARRRLPQCRLHPLEGAAAHRRRHGRSQGDGRARHRLFGAADRPCQAARSQGEGGRQIDRRPCRHGEGAQGLRAAGGRTSFSTPTTSKSLLNNGGGRKVVKFDKAIIAAGSQAIKLPFIPDDPRVVDSTGAWSCDRFPKSMLVIGGGIIGLEMATVYSTLGTRIDVVEMLDGLMTGADRDLVKVWEKKNAGRFDKVMLKTKTVSAEATPDGIKVGFEGEKAPAEPQLYDMVLVAVGPQSERQEDRRREGGRRGERPRLHPGRQADAHQHAAHLRHRRHRRPADAGAQGRARGPRRGGDRGRQEQRVRGAPDPFGRLHRSRRSPGRASPRSSARRKGIKYGKAVFPWAASGRAIANGRDEGFTKLLFDEANHRVLGGGIVGTHAGDLIGEVCLAVEMGCDPVDIGKTIHPHPTLCESIGMTAEVFEGVCTDLPPAKKR